MNHSIVELNNPNDESGMLQQRLLWLNRIRWYAAMAMLCTGLVSIVTSVYLFQAEVLCLFSLVMLGYNYFFKQQIQSNTKLSLTALYQVLSDIIVLTLVLFFTGGFKNPFFTFYFGIVIIAWMILDYRMSIFVTGFVTICFAVQGLSKFSGDLKAFGDLPMHVVGAPISFVLTTVVTAYFVYIIMEDLRKRENEVLQARQQSMQAQRLAAIGQLAAGVAHEINTPLGTISLVANDALDVLSNKQPSVEDVDDVTESLQTIREQTHRCKSITKTLLEFSRKPDVIREPSDINELVNNAFEMCRQKLKDIPVKVEYSNNLPLIMIDRNSLERAVCNLLLNAADSISDTRENPSISVSTSRNQSHVMIEIEDNGCGIPEELLSRIYEPFFTTKDVGKGTGLGLYITYGIIQDAGGTLEITSQTGIGTKAVIQLPYDGGLN
jgi:signal transduction histidine kinase